MKRAAILVPRLDPGDAVGNDARSQAELLNSRGWEARIFASAWSRQTPARPVSGLKRFIRNHEDLLIHHPASLWKEGDDAFQASPARRIIKYHNVTPASFFEAHNNDYASICRKTREALRPLVSSAHLVLCDSTFNLEDIVLEGATRNQCKVVPPFHRLESRDWLDLYPLWVERFTRPGHPMFLSVGRIVPNKALEKCIEALGVMQSRSGIPAKLVLAGRIDRRLGSYIRFLEKKSVEHCIPGTVIFADHVSDTRLRTLFLCAVAYLVTSEHEGFCVPVIEAMKSRLPVIACGKTSVAETLGGQGIYTETFDAHLFASAMERLVKSKESCAIIADHASHAYETRFHSEELFRIFLEALS